MSASKVHSANATEHLSLHTEKELEIPSAALHTFGFDSCAIDWIKQCTADPQSAGLIPEVTCDSKRPCPCTNIMHKCNKLFLVIFALLLFVFESLHKHLLQLIYWGIYKNLHVLKALKPIFLFRLLKMQEFVFVWTGPEVILRITNMWAHDAVHRMTSRCQCSSASFLTLSLWWVFRFKKTICHIS